MIFDPFELNYSKIRAYLDCPFLYRYIYVERRFTPPTSFSSLGLSVHKALARFHASPGGDLTDLLGHYENVWLHQGYATPQESMEFYNKGALVLENWWLHFQENPAQVIYSEKSFEFPFEKWRVKGTIDRVDRMPGGVVELIDYKMGFEGKTGEDVAGSLQLAIYAIGLSRALKLKVGAMAYFVLTGPKKVSVPYDPSGEEAILALIRETGEKMLALDLSRKGKCDRCPIRKLCAEFEAGGG
ncbi:MAG: PD-(D/E)XK nuclease family protein [Elusimicrobiales bacterium]|nr:PD-(D/E)XK nuclease family protein [Elusimicrobiales bacterium]